MFINIQNQTKMIRVKKKTNRYKISYKLYLKLKKISKIVSQTIYKKAVVRKKAPYLIWANKKIEKKPQVKRIMR